jgi:glycerol dehydrogenase
VEVERMSRMKILIAPGRYVQGPGALEHAGEHIALLGRKALVLGGKKGLSGKVREGLLSGFKTQGVTAHMEPFGGECCRPEIDRLAEVARTQGSDLVVGVGGGKSLDTAKAVAHELKIPVAIIPTIASTDAPCSALSVIYTPEGVFESYLVLPQNPNLVVVDTRIIADAPVRLLVSGMGDAMATWFEAKSCYATRAGNMPGGASTQAAMKLAELCYELLMDYGVEARIACENHTITPAFERVVEANTLLSGMGFESAGLAAAHAIHNGLTVLPETHPYYHGEKVAFGTLAQLVLEDADREQIQDVLQFCLNVGLPVTLSDLGVKKADAKTLRPVAEAACAPGETIHNTPFEVDPDLVLQAILGADALGRACSEAEEE